MNSNKTAENLLNNLITYKLPLPYNCKKLLAFTLAEVLITLLIIGVVASIVIPALIANTQQAEMTTAWKKTYGIIAQAQLNMVRDYGSVIGAFPGIEYSASGRNNLMNDWLPYLMVTKKCTAGRVIVDNCQTEDFKTMDGSPITAYYSTSGGAGIILNDGTFINFYNGSSCGTSLCNDSYLFIDVNGSKKPNQLGKDVFRMRYIPEKDRFIPGGGGASCSDAGWDCGAYYLAH